MLWLVFDVALRCFQSLFPQITFLPLSTSFLFLGLLLHVHWHGLVLQKLSVVLMIMTFIFYDPLGRLHRMWLLYAFSTLFYVNVFLSRHALLTRLHNYSWIEVYEGGNMFLTDVAVALICALRDLSLFLAWIFCLIPVIEVILREAFPDYPIYLSLSPAQTVSTTTSNLFPPWHF